MNFNNCIIFTFTLLLYRYISKRHYRPYAVFDQLPSTGRHFKITQDCLNYLNTKVVQNGLFYMKLKKFHFILT